MANRIIKFRAWHESGMIMPSEIYGDIRDEYVLSLSGEVLFVKEESNGNYCPPDLAIRSVRGLILMQFTGLQDKNGKDIYEGDIVSFSMRMYEVCINFNGYYLQRYKLWRGQFKPSFRYGLSLIAKPLEHSETLGVVDSAEIIGNIYENPELIENNHTNQ